VCDFGWWERIWPRRPRQITVRTLGVGGEVSEIVSKRLTWRVNVAFQDGSHFIVGVVYVRRRERLLEKRCGYISMIDNEI
jgi:hypothetical protein